MTLPMNATQELDVLALVAKKWTQLVVGLTLGLVVGLALAFLLPKRYEAAAILAPVSDQTSGAGMSGLLGQFNALSRIAPRLALPGESSTEEYLAILGSRSFYEGFIRDEDLLPALFPEYRKVWADVGSKPRDRSPSAADAARLLANEIVRVQQNPKTGLVRVSVTWGDPALAARWANQLVDRLNYLARSRAIREAETGLGYLRNQLDSTVQLSLRDALNALVELQLQKIMLAQVRTDYAFRVVDPAIAPDRQDFVSPRRALVIFLSGLSGLLLAGCWILLRERMAIVRSASQR